MEYQLSRVYVLTDSKGRITQCDGGYTITNIKDFTGWTLIDEGVGDRYNLCQSHYFDALYTEDGIPRYCLVDGVPKLRSDVEIDGDREPPAPVQTMEERIEELEAQNAMLTECILEISEMLYNA